MHLSESTMPNLHINTQTAKFGNKNPLNWVMKMRQIWKYGFCYINLPHYFNKLWKEYIVRVL